MGLRPKKGRSADGGDTDKRYGYDDLG